MDGLTDNISISTISRPETQNCTIQPQLGFAGQTLFSISCISIINEMNDKDIYEYYQKSKNDDAAIGNMLIKCKLKLKYNRNNTFRNIFILPNLILNIIGVLLDRGYGSLTDFMLTSSNNFTVKIINPHGASIQVHLVASVNNIFE